jgi:hypothetical protein
VPGSRFDGGRSTAGGWCIQHRPPVGGRPRSLSSDGGSSSVELVFVVPVVMLLMMVGLQFALYGLAAHAVALAAAEGGASARATTGGAGPARALVARELSAVAGNVVENPTVSISTGAGDQVSVSVSGAVPSILPGLHLSVNSVSDGPAQLFRGGG